MLALRALMLLQSLAGRDGHVVEAGAVVDDADDPLVAA